MECGPLIATQVATCASSHTENSSALASWWHKERKIFSIALGSTAVRYPGLQSDSSGVPEPFIVEVLSVSHDMLEGGELTFSFASNNDWLCRARPVDCLVSDRAGVVYAITKLADQLVT